MVLAQLLCQRKFKSILQLLGDRVFTNDNIDWKSVRILNVPWYWSEYSEYISKYEHIKLAIFLQPNIPLPHLNVRHVVRLISLKGIFLSYIYATIRKAEWKAKQGTETKRFYRFIPSSRDPQHWKFNLLIAVTNCTRNFVLNSPVVLSCISFGSNYFIEKYFLICCSTYR